MREQLAVEWKHDLGLIPLCNAELRRHRSEVVANHSDELEKLQYEIAPGSIEGEEGNGEGGDRYGRMRIGVGVVEHLR